jgi:ATP-dependent helicase/nuclease subunit A
LRSPLFSFSDDALLALRLQKDENENQRLIWDALNNPAESFPHDELERLSMARECLHYLRGIAGRVTISEFLRAALEKTGYLAVLSGLPDGARRRGNVEKLLEKAQSTGKVTLGEFSRYLRDLSTREAREGEAVVDVSGAVSIMTIHASKGLEFPVIVLADSSWRRRGGDNDLLTYHDGEMACKVYDFEQDKLVIPAAYRRMSHFDSMRGDAENLRLLYVAATRAQDYLIVSGQARFDNKSGGWKSGGWLDVFLETSDLHLTIREFVDVVHHYGSIDVRVTLPHKFPADETMMQTNAKGKSGWDVVAPLMEGVMPPLLRDVEIHLDAPARHLAATHIADLGSAEYADNIRDRDIARERFLRQVFHDAPTRIETASNRSSGASASQIGEIVHEALRYGHLPGDDDNHLLDLLRGYAWHQGISDEKDCNEAANKALRLLRNFKDSQAYVWLESAIETYRELPFIYRRQGFVIHGIIDVLFRLPDGRWIVMDYKTSYVAGGSHEAAVRHAWHYHLQLGIYAEAVQKQLGGIVPETYIHYIRYGHTVGVREVAWREALERGIRSRIEEIIKMGRS